MAERVDGRDFKELEVTQWGGIPQPNVSPTNTGRIYYDATNDYFMLSENGGAYVRILGLSLADGRFLKLDASNDPLTGELVITPASGTNALKANKDITLKAGQKLILDGD